MSIRSDDGIYREATRFAQLQDEFVLDAGFFGIEVPDKYGCISGCHKCRNFRNAVRAAREVYDAEKAATATDYYSLSLDELFQAFGNVKPYGSVAEPTGDAINERIAVALELIAARLA